MYVLSSVKSKIFEIFEFRKIPDSIEYYVTSVLQVPNLKKHTLSNPRNKILRYNFIRIVHTFTIFHCNSCTVIIVLGLELFSTEAVLFRFFHISGCVRKINRTKSPGFHSQIGSNFTAKKN